ncbi:N-acetylated-alpha-linked acidic dipeptidase 2-like [Mya arenaria]|uniref:N-acetylated-alpha-linked acidic dipeptidase 2-like n=1 Tax=Mya arenaria TaxID=6604 RepID=UPI0022E1BF48|nr:N-acetylated-alpha-linked acidic dipeptidase 2-like [Mya arenaria]
MEELHSSTENVYYRRSQSRNNRCIIILTIVVAIVAFVVGILIGRYATCPEMETNDPVHGFPEELMKDADPEISKLLINGMNSDKIRQNLKMLTEKPHLGGTDENHELGRKLKEFWEENGLDHVVLAPYKVQLSYPNMSNLNYVELLDDQGNSMYKSNLTEPILTPEENKTGVVPPFNAYSPPGDIQGVIVYVNYGRVEDHEYLEQNTSVSVKGKIVLARYGKIFRGDKVKQAEIRGAIGIILYSDPDDITAGDVDKVYPNDWWLPPSGAQRGSIYIGVGDPLTPGYPATEWAYRKRDPNEYMPGIPCHPVGYGIAIELMRSLAGGVVPEDWRGKMNVTYRFGDAFQNQGWKARIFITTHSKVVTTYNVMGIIRGAVEPDRYVLVGNHRDAWVFGALDPSSGTATMMEMSRVIGQLVKSGKWRPRRSIIFCSWGAEEYGLVGSIEWVEHYTKILQARAVAYLNVDIAVEGNSTLRALGTPLLYRSLYSATKKVPNPNSTEVAAGRSTVYDTWYNTYPWQGYHRPEVKLPGSGSDYAPFRDRIGIPCVDIRYSWNKNKLKLSSYPMYHSVYETFYLVDRIMDIGFKYHTAVGQVWIEMARQLSDEVILPFNVTDLTNVIEDQTDSLLDRFGQLLSDNQVDIDLLRGAVKNLTNTVERFENKLEEVDKTNPYVVRQVNDQLMNIEKAFIDPNGLPGRKYKHHLLFTESSVDNYAGSSYPGLSDALTRIVHGDNATQQWEVVHKHFSVLLFVLQSAQSVIRDVSNFMYSY